MKKILLSLCMFACSYWAQAQTPYALSGTSYTQNFDLIGSGLPLGWRVDSVVNKNAGLGNDAITRFSTAATTWGNVSRGFKNLASADGLLATANTADQNASTDRVLGIRQVSAAGWDDKDSLVSASFQIANTTGLTGFNLQFKIQSLNTGAKRYHNWIVQYGFGAAPTSFTTVTTTPAILTLDSNFTNTSVTVSFGASLDNQNQPVWIRLMPADTSMGGGNRPHVGIDDFNLTWTGVAVNNIPQLVTLSPADNATGVAAGVTNLTVTFDKNISIGTGNITVYNITDVTNVMIPAANATVAGMTATIPGVTLLTGKDYAVQFDSTCFKNGTYSSLGIYNNTEWNFSTSLPNTAVTSLNESFMGCNAPLLGSFSQSSVVGSQSWRCSNFGHNDTDAVYMNGYAGGVTNDNEDWLVSPTLDMSAMTAPYLHFWSKKRFTGTNTKEVFVSSNYTGDVTTATWTPLSINFASLDSIYIPFNNTNLTAYKAAPFHIAFKYVSLATGSADEWSIDDVMITDGPVSVKTFEASNIKFSVLGNTNESQLNLLLESDKMDHFDISVIDMMGNRLCNTSFNVMEGKNKLQIVLPSMAAGLYFVKVSNKDVQGTLKFTKQ
ncbi:MAG: choice-of-anchor J domain-containing protein [Bacteroidetes bacterium]|nr:choice-of-anchor J domain-containing protein [Bacteroidota bacterium]